MDRTISSVLTLLAIGLALLFAPFMLRSCLSPAGSASTASSPKEESSRSADDSFDDEEEDFQPAAASYGTLTLRQVRMYIEVRRRARALRDELIARHQPTDGVAAKAAEELGFDSEEYESVRRKIDSVLRLEASTPEERSRLSRNWSTLDGLRDDLKSVGVLVPTSEAMTAAVYPRSESMRPNAEPWGPQLKAVEDDRREALRKLKVKPARSPYGEALRSRDTTNETSTAGYGVAEAENQRRLQQWIEESKKQDGQ